MTVELQLYADQADHICRLIENEQEYLGELLAYLPALNQAVSGILAFAQNAENAFTINEQFVLQVLKDIVYGIEHKDPVFLLDVLRYGLLEIYDYAANGLQSEVQDE